MYTTRRDAGGFAGKGHSAEKGKTGGRKCTSRWADASGGNPIKLQKTSHGTAEREQLQGIS